LGWPARITALMKDADLPRGALEVELTENTLATPNPQVLAHLEVLRHLGVALAIDDFGTGYSSLAYLQRLPVSVIKIDKSFVKNVVTVASDRALVGTILSLARHLGYRTVAEGVETEEQRATLREAGCDWGQGWLVSPALPIEEFEQRFLVPACGGRA
jgi:EAL domain-containing protein (putative c-di-GMP-specific phosphodiesterase class I)